MSKIGKEITLQKSPFSLHLKTSLKNSEIFSEKIEYKYTCRWHRNKSNTIAEWKTRILSWRNWTKFNHKKKKENEEQAS